MATEFMAIHWSAIDRASNPGDFVRYLDTVGGLETIQRIKRLTYDLLQAREGCRLLDVGCGTGEDVRALALRVGTSGRVVGVDGSRSMVAEAKKRTLEANLPVEFRVDDAERLDFEDNEFDGCRAERVFMHLNHPQRALAEMVRVTRSGGRIVVSDRDWETLIVDADDRETTRKLSNFHCDSGGSRWIGRQLRRLFCEVGLSHIAVITDTLVFTDYREADVVFQLHQIAAQATAAGVVSEPQAAAWLDDLERAQQRGTFFASVTGFCVSGEKP